MIAMANKSNKSITFHGSRKGMEFLSKKQDILREFFLFSMGMSLYFVNFLKGINFRNEVQNEL